MITALFNRLILFMLMIFGRTFPSITFEIILSIWMVAGGIILLTNASPWWLMLPVILTYIL